MRKPMRIATVAGTAGALALGGTAAAFAVQGGGQQAQPRASYSQPAAPADVSAAQARHDAQRLVPGGKVTKTELDHEHGRAVWEVDLTRGGRHYEVRIDQASRKVLSIHSEPADESGARASGQPAAGGPAGAGQARRAAQQAVPGGVITETERDHEHGRAVWEVDLTKGGRHYEVKVDAGTGKILSVHYDTHSEPELGDED